MGAICQQRSNLALHATGTEETIVGQAAVLDHGYKQGLYNIVFAASGTDKMLENVAIAWASAVLWIRPRR